MVHPPHARSRLWILIPFAALLACVPEFLHGPSCGHDFDFHLLSWFEAAAQLRHAAYPHWSTTAAWHAGEPRFTFYPPASWLLGALLTLLLPPNAVPIAFTFLCLTFAGLAMHRLARELTGSATSSLLAACLYLANPYLLFTAYERTAFAELLAAALFPLLLLTLLRPRLRVIPLALTFAALWLTNVPAAVMGTYCLAFLLLLRLLSGRNSPPKLLLPACTGTLLGLALAAFYLLPVLAERRWIQIDMVGILPLSPDGNTLFFHLGDPAHDRVLHTASLIAILVLAFGLLATCMAARQNASSHPSLRLLGLLLLTILFLQTRSSLPLWHHLPALALLQFPWRLVSIAACLACAAFALAIHPFSRLPSPVVAVTSLALVGLLVSFATPVFRQGCDTNEPPASLAFLLQTGHGFAPTDEYTPVAADNDDLRPDSAAWWLVPPDHPTQPAPTSHPSPAALAPDSDSPPSPSQTLSTPAPHHLTLHLDRPEILVLNLRDWPAWQITRNGQPFLRHVTRPDGLIALPLPAGDSTVDLRWHTPPAFLLGDLLSFAALLTLLLLHVSPLKSKPDLYAR